MPEAFKKIKKFFKRGDKSKGENGGVSADASKEQITENGATPEHAVAKKDGDEIPAIDADEVASPTKKEDATVAAAAPEEPTPAVTSPEEAVVAACEDEAPAAAAAVVDAAAAEAKTPVEAADDAKPVVAEE